MDQVSQIKDKLDIASFISEYVTLKKAGRNFTANCPFHNEKSPSFVVSPERQIWHCFGCAKGGDIYTFLMEYEKMEFPEALRLLAKRAGIQLASQEYTSGVSSKKELLYRINSLAKEYYHYVLTKHTVGKKALAYLDKRGVSEKMRQTFQIGFSPVSGSALSEYLTQKKKFAVQDIVDAGLGFQRGGRLVDFFRGRLMFPLIDHRDNVIGFSGRILDADETTSKYINTRETLVYHKGDHFYGINITKDAIRREGQAIVVEGELDVISCFGHGISNVVGVKGTALTENQVALLSRYGQKITFCFDGDKAGQEAIKRSLLVVEKKGLTPTVIEIPGGKDPDESLKKDAGAFKKAAHEDIGIYDYLLKRTIGSVDIKTPEGKKLAADTLLPLLANIKNEIVKEHYIKKISNELDTSYESIVREMQRLTVSERVSIPKTVAKIKRNKEEVLEEYLLALLVQNEDPQPLVQKTHELLSDFISAERAYQKILKQLMIYREKQETFDRKAFGNSLPKELVESYDTCLLFPLPQSLDGQKVSKEVAVVAGKLKTTYIQQKMKRLAEEMKTKEQSGEDEGLSELNKQYSQLASQLDK